jgi:hypothetical protein
MRILDSANQLLEDGAGNGDDFVCGYCGADTLPCEQHSPDCPWFSMPKIVAVLEAAQRLAETSKRHGQSGFCWGCGRLRSRALVDGLSEHKADCPWQALVAALED